MKKKQSIIFILGSISQPRCIKRIKSFIANDFDVEIYGFDRGKYNQNAIIEGKTINIVGIKEDGGNYLKKFFQSKKIIERIVNKHSSSETIFYSFGFIETFLLKFNGSNQYIYEISDILYGYKRFKYLRWLLKALDKFLIKSSLLTVFTSEGFLKFFFHGKKTENTIVQPNKVDSSFKSFVRPPANMLSTKQELVFSFIGAFRSPETILRFARIIGERYPNFRFVFYGDSTISGEVIDVSNKFTNVYDFGAFKSPDDLPLIYKKVDIVIACYDTKDLNERILEPNKLYEALFFKKPIVVSNNTFLSEKVKKFGCGFSIDASTDNSIITFLDSLKLDELERIKSSIQNISLDEIVDDNAKKIISFISQV